MKTIEAFLEAAPDAMLIANRNGVILFANLQAEQLFGYERRELNGRQVEILVPERLRKAHIEHRSNFFRTPRQRRMVHLDSPVSQRTLTYRAG
jgi:two-component system sensor histidine kinase DevS